MANLLPSPTITKAYAAPALNLPHGALNRALELESQFSAVSPYHRDAMLALLDASLDQQLGENDTPLITRAMEHQLFTENAGYFAMYAFHGSRLATLLARGGNVSQFALTATRMLLDGEVTAEKIVSMSDGQLMPELFSNEKIDEQHRLYLIGQLDNEVEATLTLYTQAILMSVPTAELYDYFHCELPHPEPEQYTDDGQTYQTDLVGLLEHFVRGDYMNPEGRGQLSKDTREALLRKYSAELEMLRYAEELRE